MKWYEVLDYWCLMRCVREPDFEVLTSHDEKYLERWYVIPQNKIFNIYYHVMRHSDDDRALHDHRAHNISIVLSGGYWEHIKGKRLWRPPGSVIFRRAATLHRIELLERNGRTQISCSLWIKFPDFRRWGFRLPSGWVDADKYDVSKAKR